VLSVPILFFSSSAVVSSRALRVAKFSRRSCIKCCFAAISLWPIEQDVPAKATSQLHTAIQDSSVTEQALRGKSLIVEKNRHLPLPEQFKGQVLERMVMISPLSVALLVTSKGKHGL
jgi:hypothetical protein